MTQAAAILAAIIECPNAERMGALATALRACIDLGLLDPWKAAEQ